MVQAGAPYACGRCPITPMPPIRVDWTPPHDQWLDHVLGGATRCNGSDSQTKGVVMSVRFPGESPDYRAARNRLLEQEIELRRMIEAVAVARRSLPRGGEIPQDYLFQERGPDGKPSDVRMSQLFAPGKDSLLIYTLMFPRYPDDKRAGPTSS